MNTRQTRQLISRQVVEMSARKRCELLRWATELAEIQAASNVSATNADLLARTYRHESLQADLLGKQFCCDPRGLLISLRDTICQQMASYEQEFPAGQSENIQKCLFEIDTCLNVISSIQAGDAQASQNLYFATCGMLWAKLDYVDNSLDQNWAQEILRILCMHRINREEALKEYGDLREQYKAELADSTECDLQSALQTQFRRARIKLRAQMNKPCYQHSSRLIDFKNAAEQILTEIDALKERQRLNGRPFDVKLYTSILSKTNELLVAPGNEVIVNEYRYLMHHNNQGTESISMLLSGVMLAFVGFATVAGTFTAEALSVGLSSSVTLPLKVAGFFSMGAGVTLLCAGRRSDAAKALDNFDRQVGCFNEGSDGDRASCDRDEALPLLAGSMRY